ncbi:MAG: protein kinase [Kofleriaceae bacterium]|nr:protein kinase [Kofleriaceae bacterium]
MFVCPECGAAAGAPAPCPNDGTAMVDRGDDPLLGTTIGVYRVARLLGVGGMGRVYKGVHPQIGSRVAIKVLSRECSERKDLVDRFFSEARAVNLIRHESIVNVLDLATLPDGRPYIIMEYLDGAPLADIIAKQGPLPLGGLARLIAEVLDALGAAHGKGIVHRDLKPDNIYVSPAGRAKVLDFGIAKLLPEMGGTSTRTGSLMGTPHYMSPEQALGKVVDYRTDLYAVGIILYECVTGRRPFNSDSLFDLLRQHVDVVPPPPHTIRPDLPPEFEQIIMYALAKDPAHRYASAFDMAQALGPATTGLPGPAWNTITPSGRTGVSGAGSWPGPTSPMSQPSPLASTPPAASPSTPGHPPSYPAAPSGQGHPPSHPAGPAWGAAPSPPPGAHLGPTVSAGQVVAPAPAPGRPARAGGGKGGLLIVGALVLAGGAVAAALVLTRGDDKPATVAETPAPTVDPGTPANGPLPIPDPVEGAGQDDDDDDDSGADDDPAAPAPAPTAPTVPAGDDLADQLAEAEKSIEAIADPDLRELARKQLAASKAMLKNPAVQQMMKQAADPKFQAQLAEAMAGLDDSSPAGGGGGGATGAWITRTSIDPPPGFPAAIDASAYTAKAIALARKHVPDAELFRIDASGVRPGGKVDLTIDNSTSLDFRFVSRSRDVRPPGIPRGARYEAQCMFRILIGADGAVLMPMNGWECKKEVTLAPPRCSLAQLWKKAAAQGAPTDDVIGEFGYRTTPSSKTGVWYVDIAGEFSKILPDDC